jgi:hypothetical protein
VASDANGERLNEALLTRAQEAVDAAAAIVAESEVMAQLAAVRRGKGLMSRCAWCSRFRVEGRWVVVEPWPGLENRTSHGICEDCVAALREVGMSV